MKQTGIIKKIEKIIIEFSENNRGAIYLLVFTTGIFFFKVAYKYLSMTFISFNSFGIIVISAVLISIILSFLKLKILSFLRKIWLLRIAGIYISFSSILMLFFSLNFFISSKTSIEYDGYERINKKITHNIIGQKKYKIEISEDTWHDWSSSGWVVVDSATYYERNDWITVKIRKGLLGFNVIDRNQKK